MKNKTTIYHLILDGSASMEDLKTKTIEGFNAQISTIKELQQTYPKQKFLISLTVFNQKVDHKIEAVKVTKLDYLDQNSYVPQGLTALLDGIGESILKTDRKYGKLVDSEKASVVVVIITDGYENASKRFDYSAISLMIQEKERSSQWSFSFIGADIDAIQASRGLKMRKQNVHSFAKKNFDGMMEDVGNSMRAYSNQKSKGIIEKDFMASIERDLSGNSLELNVTRFWVKESTYQDLLASGADLHINVNPRKGKHPRGSYFIPHNAALSFIEGKRNTPNWDTYQDFKQDGIPRDLRPFFHPK